MHTRLENHAKNHIRHPGDGDVLQAMDDHGPTRMIEIMAWECIRRRNAAEKEGEDSLKSAYANLAYTLLKASDEFMY